MVDLAWLAAAALGHACLAVWTVNVAHGMGINAKGLDWAKIAQLTILAGLTLALGWFAWTGDRADWPWPLLIYGWVCVAVALVGLPAVTIARGLRRLPTGVEPGPVATVDLADEHGRETLIGAGRGAWWLRLPGNESLRLRQVEWSVGLPGLPAALDGLTIWHLSDLHFGPHYSRRYFEAAIGRLEGEPADLVLFTGDLIDDDATIDWVVPVLGGLRGRLGQFAIVGNHDYRHDADGALGALEAAGFTAIEGRWTTIDFDGATLALGGTSEPWGPRLDLDAAPAADQTILLSHSPDTFPRAARRGIDLVLAGHNHGGQYRLPIVGPVLMPSVYSRRYDRGFFRRGRSTLFVQQGLGAEHPLRFGGCTPEIVRLTLVALPVRPGDRRDDRFAAATGRSDR